MPAEIISPSAVGRDRYQLKLTGLGLLTENFQRTLVPASAIMIDGTTYVMSVGLRAGDVASAVTISVATAGATMSLSKVGLYDKAGNRLAVSADQGAAWAATGQKTPTFATPYTVPTDDLYYVAVVAKGATLPTLHRGSSNVILAAAIGSGAIHFGSVATQTDLTATLAIAVGAAPIDYWVAVS